MHLLDRVRKTVRTVGVIVFLAAPTMPAGASEWSDRELEIIKQTSDWATEFAKSSNKISPIAKALANAADRLMNSTFLETVTDKNMIRDEDLERLDAERREMDKVMPPNPHHSPAWVRWLA